MYIILGLAEDAVKIICIFGLEAEVWLYTVRNICRISMRCLPVYLQQKENEDVHLSVSK